MARNSLKLFDDTPRVDSAPCRDTEGLFNFYNRSARPREATMRKLLESWFSSYPSERAPQLLGRFRNKDDESHEGAFFELLICQLLTRLGCTVTVEPDITTPTRPDFVVEPPSGQQFYVETTLCRPRASQETKIEQQVFDVINKIACPDFWLYVKAQGTICRTPPLNKLRQEFQKWVNQLDYNDEVRAVQKGGGDLPHYSYPFSNWMLTLEALPRSVGDRGLLGERLLDVSSDCGGFVDLAPLTKKIREKATKYGILKAPFIVAVNLIETWADRRDIVRALFGWGEYDEGVNLVKFIPPAGHRMYGSSVWAKDKNTRVSGVLLFENLKPHSMVSDEVRMCLYSNPWATHPVPGLFCNLSYAVAAGDRVKWFNGTPVGKILGF